MRQGGKAATKWLQRKNATAPVSIITKEHDQTTLSDSAKESIQKIEEFWSTYWENSENHVGEGMEAWRQRNQPVNHTLSDNPLTVFDPAILFSESRRLKGSTAGPDGWYGDELATWPLHAWTIYSALVKRWVNRESVAALQAEPDTKTGSRKMWRSLGSQGPEAHNHLLWSLASTHF